MSTVALTKAQRSTSRLCNYFMVVIWPFSTHIPIFRVRDPSPILLHSFFQNQSFHSFDLYTTAFTRAKTFRYCLSVFLIAVRLCFCLLLSRPIHDAAEGGHVDVLRVLLSYGADPLLATYSGNSALSCSKEQNSRAFLKGSLHLTCS